MLIYKIGVMFNYVCDVLVVSNTLNSYTANGLNTSIVSAIKQAITHTLSARIIIIIIIIIMSCI